MKKILLKIIDLYQKTPFHSHRNCRYVPTCSEYAKGSIHVHGALKGGLLSLYRIIRCNPFSKGGLDPVKELKKMKKTKILLLLIISTIILSGCIKRDSFENIEVYTTVYPIEYIVDRLYGENSNVKTIYPDGVVPSRYSLTDKQIRDYSSADLFVFNGQSDEKDYVIPLFNENPRLRIIDTSLTMEPKHGVEELWLDPSNFLMLAQNVRNGLKEYITNTYLINEVDARYEELKVEVSRIDANMRLMAESATTKRLLVSNDMLTFLEKYGLEVISIDDRSVTDRTLVDARRLIENEAISYLYVLENEELSDDIKKFIEDTEVEVVELHSLSNLSEQERRDRRDFISIVMDNIDLLKKELY